VNEKKIYNHFGSMLIQLKLVEKIKSVSMKDQAVEYKDILAAHKNMKIVIIFHSLDNPNFLNSESQKYLS
jgi:hypothetical protein